jgi:undecaprenyl-diphosphatase
MNWMEGIVLGVVQGLTEFLPVSSTGHLILAREWLGLNTDGGLAVDATLHLATALAVLLYFKRDLWKLFKTGFFMVSGKEVDTTQKTLFSALLIGTVPAVVLGIFLEDIVNTAFREIHLVAYALIAGSFLFMAAEWLSKQNSPLTWQKGFLLGLFQALALIPGISRSGSVISGGLLLGLKREDAARFAFLLSFPIILGAGGKKFLELLMSDTTGGIGMPLFLAALAAFASGLVAIHFLITFLRTHTLYPFIVYRLILAAVILIFLV